MKPSRLLYLLSFLCLSSLIAAPPGLINHQGRLVLDGVNYDGGGHFKFALVDASGNTTYWSNDGSSTGGGEPTSAVPVTLAKGHYAVALGDTTLANMNTAVPADIFVDQDDVYLRIWFSESSGGIFQRLTPDRRITSGAYALSAKSAGTAAVAEGVVVGGVTESMLAENAVTGEALAPGVVTGGNLAPGAAAENIDAAGSLGIGVTGDLAATVHLDGEVGFIEPSLLAEIVDGQNGFSRLNGATSVFVSGTTAYVASVSDDSLTIIDVSNPASPALLAEVVDGQNGFNRLDGPESVFVSGTTAYVASYFDDSLTIIDVSNPASPALLAEVVDGQNGFNRLNGAKSVFVSGTTAYVASVPDDSLTIIDVSNPASPALLAEVVDGQNGFNQLSGAWSVFVSGTTAYVASVSDDSLTIIDVSNPASPTLSAEVVDDQNGFNRLDRPESVFVSGTTAYVASYFDDSLTIIDVSNPASPTLLAQVVDGQNGFSRLDGAQSVFVSGTRAYVASSFGNSLTIIDMSNPASPTLLAEVVDGQNGFNRLYALSSVFVSGTTAYVAAVIDDSLTVIDVMSQTAVDLATSNRVGVGTSRPDAMLHVEGDAFFTGSLLDSSKGNGSVGQILSSTGNGTSWVNLLDNDPTNELQGLSLTGDTLDINGGSSVDLSQYLRREAETSSFPVGQMTRTTPHTNLEIRVTEVRAKSSGDVLDGFGPFQVFSLEDSAASPSQLVLIGAERAGSDDTGDFVVQTYNAGARSERFRITAPGDIGVRTPDPLARFHLQDSSLGLDDTIVDPNDDLIVEGGDAYIGLYSNDAGSLGSAISLHEVSGGALEDTWKMIRETSGNGSELRWDYTNSAGTTDTEMYLTTTGNLFIDGTLNPTSDRAAKENFSDIDGEEILDRIAALPIKKWNYKGDERAPHIGPVAQDFHQAFGLGASDKHISTVDADGVALAAIQSLHSQVKAQAEENAALKERINQLESLTRQLLESNRQPGESPVEF